MRLRNRFARIAIISCAVLSLNAETMAEEWTGWRGPNRDAIAKGVTLPQRWPENLKKVWSIEVGDGLASPVISNDRVFVFTRINNQETISCYDKQSKLIWQQQYNAEFEAENEAKRIGIGPLATPAISDNKIVTFGISGIITCWSTKKGTQLWQQDFKEIYRDTAPVYGIAISPLILDGTCYLHVGSDERGAFMALDLKTGKKKWDWNKDGPGYTSPILAEIHGQKQIITQSNKNCIALNPENGQLLWSVPFKTDYLINIPTPVVYKNTVIFSGYQKGVYCYEINKTDTGFVAKEKWQTRKVTMYMSSPILINEKVYSFSEFKKGQFFCLNPEDGSIDWAGPPRQAENALLLSVNNFILASTTNGEVVVFEPSEKAYKEFVRYKVTDQQCWAHPVFWGNQLLIKDQMNLTLWQIPK